MGAREYTKYNHGPGLMFRAFCAVCAVCAVAVHGARFERVALAIQRRQEEREYQRLAALGLIPPGLSISDYRDQIRSATSLEDHHRDIHGNQ